MLLTNFGHKISVKPIFLFPFNSIILMHRLEVLTYTNPNFGMWKNRGSTICKCARKESEKSFIGQQCQTVDQARLGAEADFAQ